MSKLTRDELEEMARVYVALSNDSQSYGAQLMIAGAGTLEWERVKPLYDAARTEMMAVFEAFTEKCREYRANEVADEWKRMDGSYKKAVN